MDGIMNWKRGFRETGKAFATVAAICGWFLGLNLAEKLFYDETLNQWSPGSYVANLVMSMAGAAVCGLSVWCIYKLLERLVLSFCGEKPEDQQKD